MSKRIIRVDRPYISKTLPNLLGKEVNVVLRNDHTYYGFLQEIESDSILLIDHRNHQHPLLVDQIVEIIYDEVRPW